MDTGNQQWLCDICNRKYSSKRKDKHLLTKVHKNNQERLDREADYEEYLIRRDELLMENIGDMDFLGFLKNVNLLINNLKKNLVEITKFLNEFKRTSQRYPRINI